MGEKETGRVRERDRRSQREREREREIERKEGERERGDSIRSMIEKKAIQRRERERIYVTMSQEERKDKTYCQQRLRE